LPDELPLKSLLLVGGTPCRVRVRLYSLLREIYTTKNTTYAININNAIVSDTVMCYSFQRSNPTAFCVLRYNSIWLQNRQGKFIKPPTVVYGLTLFSFDKVNLHVIPLLGCAGVRYV